MAEDPGLGAGGYGSFCVEVVGRGLNSFFFLAQTSVNDPTMAPPTMPSSLSKVCSPTKSTVRPRRTALKSPLSPSAVASSLLGAWTPLYCGCLQECQKLLRSRTSLGF
ncbi:uncharacterized protein PV07_09947 [Cladophialophora immunda]|uniref:Uncharacterized protein n=1 Tax=Cladophialophora immunda TaxID=569365 RepID=A0A0D2CKY7_9EURO|nr:uncharacterized protein PV07_09947 [Cladophialophora immunda]KIW24219.1 hypothetical protein PV07_09947 [Cladophialophora immunda]